MQTALCLAQSNMQLATVYTTVYTAAHTPPLIGLSLRATSDVNMQKWPLRQLHTPTANVLLERLIMNNPQLCLFIIL